MWKLDTAGRIAQWRDFRKSLDELPFDQALDVVAKFWQTAPFSPYNLDPDRSETWPDPWTLIYENVYCDVAKCLGIVYTLLLSKHKTALDVEIRIYQDPKTRYGYNLAWIGQGKYILNMVDGEVVNNKQFDKNLKLIKTYTAVDLQLENYI
jgi:hypothetical protein